MSKIIIRKIDLHDVSSLQQIGRQTFLETFANSNSEEDMRAYLSDGFSTEKLKAEIENPNSTFYLAELNGTVIGYLKVNTGPAQTEQQAGNTLEIERIYVLQAYHGQQVGQVLYDQAMQIAESMQVAYVWLGVWEENPRAIRFYEKNGFTIFGKHVFQLGGDEQTDILMKRPLPSTE